MDIALPRQPGTHRTFPLAPPWGPENCSFTPNLEVSMKKTLVCIALLSLGAATAVRAAEIFGTISENGKALPAGVAVKLDCGSGSGSGSGGGGASVSGATDQFGSYSLKSTATGDCRLTLTYKGANPSLPVTLYEKPGKYDLVVRGDAGKLTLSRK